MLVGRTSFCNAPLEALRVETVSDLQTPDYEKVVARRPDLVLMTFAGNISTNYHKLRDLGLQVYVIHDSTIAGSINAIDTIGTFLGKKEEATRLTTRLRGTIDSISALARGTTPVTTFVVIDKVPLITASKGFIDEAIRLAGGENIAAGGSIAYPQYAREELLRKDPEVIIVPALSWKDVDDLIAAYPEWKRLRAVRNNRVYALPVEIISRPGPRIGEAVTLLYQALHGGDPRQLSRF
jgi:iron complex transport system substrate-binding protein